MQATRVVEERKKNQLLRMIYMRLVLRLSVWDNFPLWQRIRHPIGKKKREAN